VQIFECVAPRGAPFFDEVELAAYVVANIEINHLPKQGGAREGQG
jgi:hypothetical protein